jgi:hypothetical protein
VVVLAILVSLPLGVCILAARQQRRTNARVERFGGFQSVSDIKSRLGHRRYSLVSMPNEAGKPEIWVFPYDVGPSDAFEVAERSESERGNGGDVFRKAIVDFRNRFEATDLMILQIDGDVLTAVRRMHRALDCVENEIGFPAAQKIDFCFIN